MADTKNNCGHNHDDCCCDQEPTYITLETEDDRELKCELIGVFEVEEIPDKEYMALVPVDSDEALLYQYIELDEGDSFELVNIESDEEFETVENAFMSMIEDDCEEE